MPRSRRSRSISAQDLRLDGHVERRRRLVGDEQARLAGERDGDHHALPLPAGQLVRIAVELLARRRQADQVEQLRRPLERRGAATARDGSPAPRRSASPTVNTGFSDVIGSWKIIADAVAAQRAQRLRGERQHVARRRPGCGRAAIATGGSAAGA